MRPLDPAIEQYYRLAPEESRLEQGAAQLESTRTRELISRFAPAPPATVLDVGGAAGAYGFWLADAGYAVHLIDLSLRLVEVAEQRSRTRSHPLASCRVGDARALSAPDDSADFVLLLGPLYHLTEKEDRVRALREAARVLKPGGWLFGAAISRWASALDGLSRGLFTDPRFVGIVERDLREGQHRNTTERVDYFTTAYFHRPEELRSEVDTAGFNVVGIYGLEGPGWLLPDLEARMAESKSRESLLEVARQLESEPSALGLSAHWLIVAQNQ